MSVDGAHNTTEDCVEMYPIVILPSQIAYKKKKKSLHQMG